MRKTMFHKLTVSVVFGFLCPVFAVLASLVIHPKRFPYFLSDFCKILFDSLFSAMLGEPLGFKLISGFFPCTTAIIAGQIPLTIMKQIGKVFNQFVKFLIAKIAYMVLQLIAKIIRLPPLIRSPP